MARSIGGLLLVHPVHQLLHAIFGEVGGVADFLVVRRDRIGIGLRPDGRLKKGAALLGCTVFGNFFYPVAHIAVTAGKRGTLIKIQCQ